MTRILTLTTAIAAGFLVTAQAEARDGRPGFAAVDSNGDGQVTQAEFQAFQAQQIATRFDRADSNNDGLLSEAELTAAAEERRTRRTRNGGRVLARLDTDGDGGVSQAELTAMTAGRGRVFDRLDANGDGAITAAEFDKAKRGFRVRRDQTD